VQGTTSSGSWFHLWITHFEKLYLPTTFRNLCFNKCVSRLARRKCHHTALRDRRPQFRLPQCNLCIAHPGSNAAAVTPREPKFTKMGEDLPDSSRTKSMQVSRRNLFFRRWEIRYRTNKQKTDSELSIPILPYGGIKIYKNGFGHYVHIGTNLGNWHLQIYLLSWKLQLNSLAVVSVVTLITL